MLLTFANAVSYSDKISLIASISCISLLILMLVKPPKSVGNYRFCYYTLTSLECISAISHYFGAPCFYVDSDRFLTFPIHGPIFAHVVWMTAYHAFEILLTACFLYRYITVCQVRRLLVIFESKLIFTITISILVLVIALMTSVFYTFFIPTDALSKKVTEILPEAISINFIDDHFLAGFDYDIGHVFLPTAVVQAGCIISSVFSILFMVVMCASALLISNYIKKNAFSASQTKQHYRVLLLLSLQAIVPFCFVYSLALSCTIAIPFRVDISFIAPIFTLTTSIPPLVGSFTVVGLTNEYRKMITRALGRKTTAEKTSKDLSKKSDAKKSSIKPVVKISVVTQK